ncbi:LysM domain-containing GPI-anchored protein 2 [Hibiscus syriacus]|uniref:LysM domain-containing GPI-anchored protein 2 n=1 Tax=Hibiscus syriacus TaxID=106335 RepID=A0A6A2ZSF7_HIBSY|nr:lysM domain-containing GPI-anchored protein 1-like [Hibiscus syriacus]KAE8694760.1 LysM domain-containing GPI-anchored protein 2 [Hibiscus syriacus]
MSNQRPTFFSFVALCFIVFSNVALVTSKSTIEPCSNSDSCNALLGYTLYTDLKVAEVASLFQVDPIAVLTANAIDISYPDVENHILPSRLFLKIPIQCSCVEGFENPFHQVQNSPTGHASSIADSIYAGLVSADQIREVNSIADPSVLDVGENLVVPLPCTCFNGTDNGLPAVYLSYVVKPVDTLAGIAASYSTTITDLMNVNAMGTSSIKDGDILAVPLSACASNFPKYALDYGLIVPNGSYAITASHCVQCSCGPGSRNLYCMPSSLAVSCSSLQCKSSNLKLGNVTVQQSSAGCNVTSCAYGGYANGTIIASLSSSLEPRCPGPQQFPTLVAPPTYVPDSAFAPAPSPQSDGSTTTVPKTSTVPSTGSLPGFGPAGAPLGSMSEASTLVNSVSILPAALMTCLLIKLISPVSL